MKKILFGFIGILLFVGIGWFGLKIFTDSSGVPPDLASGEKAYAANCLTCHGIKGHGDGVATAAMTVKPDNIYEELKNPFGFKAELVDSVLSGDNGQDGTMPAFKGILTKRDVNNIFGYIVSVNESNE